ncbi:hypothetical protein JFV28_20510 [Pseudomonas sp. TH05]|uniref:hypothetical protein n=1 Tax=unclassified Pseudomonas TaxID=196821 RepID=UPI00191498FA|nr:MULTISPECIES: hypothetical protein [unclassified Pseudomonas]MBK5541493.1 hypothetical protein [Pseudomonas sp. TH07]MBK5558228.1 hypothetical protein [Pseudomonas sp. TH05]
MIVFARIGFNDQTIIETEDLPEGFTVGMVEMVGPRPEDEFSALYVALENGTWAISESLKRSKLSTLEDVWRAIEMPIARENVTAIEFGDDQIPGTAADWKAYWLALRAWTESAEGYPDSTHRPLKPA